MDDGLFSDSDATAIAFEGGTEMELVPGETQRLRVQVQPPERHSVRFALIGDAPPGAFLSENRVETGDDGVAETRLTVLSAAPPFEVRAAAGQVETTLTVVSQSVDSATLLVTPRYEGSPRAPGVWSASVHLDQTCAGLQGIPYPDGMLEVETASLPVRLERVPVDRPLAVVIRGERFAGGCRAVPSLLANSETQIEIEVLDRPMQISDLQLDLSFSVQPANELNPALNELAFRAASALTSEGTDLSAVLDAMSLLASDPAAFEQARATQDWSALLVDSLSEAVASTGLREAAQGLMRAGLWRLYEERALSGELSVAGSAPARLVLQEVMGVPAEAAGFEPESSATLMAESEDYLRIGAALSFQPSMFLEVAANLAATAEDPGRTSAADALAGVFDCANMGALLADAGVVEGEAYAGCDAGCVRGLCESAMGVIWQRVGASELPSVPWQFSAAARATVDERARPLRVAGTWVGSLSVPNFPEPPAPVPIQGPFMGSD